jgi:hypothetical protein
MIDDRVTQIQAKIEGNEEGEMGNGKVGGGAG